MVGGGKVFSQMVIFHISPTKYSTPRWYKNPGVFES
jgi:hypothetical protein